VVEEERQGPSGGRRRPRDKYGRDRCVMVDEIRNTWEDVGEVTGGDCLYLVGGSVSQRDRLTAKQRLEEAGARMLLLSRFRGG
jgi:hypothetical protein